MARKKNTARDAAAPLRKAPVRIGQVNTNALVSELRALHEAAGGADTMPDDTELYAALQWTERHAAQLDAAAPEVRRRAALTRVLLWEHLREQTDLHQMRAVTAARDAGATWADLTTPLAVRAPSAAYNKAQRLAAAALTDATDDDRPVRRTPEALAAARLRHAARERATHQRRQAATERHPLVAAAAHRLLDHREHLTADDDTDFWLDEAAYVLTDCTTAIQQESLQRYLAAALRHLQHHHRTIGQPPTTHPHALAALQAVAALVANPS
ncbi:hypothetical protein [Streptomyces abyssomicinicus]|uniref:hypothetical protein n=1 Tax=Streptomyces abyssomicinicus TaxID=574929 RepID=UPI001FEA36F6|nr:hypothetical protein [Streptomyces abyssomicinicus]